MAEPKVFFIKVVGLDLFWVCVLRWSCYFFFMLLYLGKKQVLFNGFNCLNLPRGPQVMVFPCTPLSLWYLPNKVEPPPGLQPSIHSAPYRSNSAICSQMENPGTQARDLVLSLPMSVSSSFLPSLLSLTPVVHKQVGELRVSVWTELWHQSHSSLLCTICEGRDIIVSLEEWYSFTPKPPPFWFPVPSYLSSWFSFFAT